MIPVSYIMLATVPKEILGEIFKHLSVLDREMLRIALRISNVSYLSFDKVLKWAVESKNTKWKRRCKQNGRKLVKLVIDAGDLCSLRLLKKCGYEFGEFSQVYALRKERLKCFKYIIHRVVECPIYGYIVDVILDSNNIQALKIYYKRCIHRTHTPITCNKAAQYGSLECLKYLVRNGHLLTGNIDYYAAYSGNRDMLRYLGAMGYSDISNRIAGAAAGGQLELLKSYADDFPGCIGEIAYWAAIKQNRIEIVKYLFTNNYSGSSSAIDACIKYDRLKIVKYLVENGCSVNKKLRYIRRTVRNREIRDYLSLVL